MKNLKKLSLEDEINREAEEIEKKVKENKEIEGMTSDEFALKLLEEEKVAVVPGTAFGDCGEGYLRISYAYSLEKLKTAIGRLGHFVEKLRAEQKNK